MILQISPHTGAAALIKENHMLSPLSILILAGLTVVAILLVSGYLMFMDGAKQYQHPEMKRELHSEQRGKDVFYSLKDADE